MKKAITPKEQADTLLFVSVAIMMFGGLIHFLPYVHGLSNLFCLSFLALTRRHYRLYGQCGWMSL